MHNIIMKTYFFCNLKHYLWLDRKSKIKLVMLTILQLVRTNNTILMTLQTYWPLLTRLLCQTQEGGPHWHKRKFNKNVIGLITV